MAQRRRGRFGCIGLVVVLALAASFFWVLHSWGGAGPLQHNASITIAPGTSLNKAADQLEAIGAISSSSRFVTLAKVFGGGAGIKAGEYRIPAHLSQADILKLLQGGKTLQRFVTIAEGYPSIMAEEKLMAVAELEGSIPVPAEGSLLPDSYSYERGDSRASIVLRMQHAMTKYLDAAWQGRDGTCPVKDAREALTLASIVEKETGKPSDRTMVAAVYCNRLRKGMMLQADPTIIYPITKGKPLGRKILRSEVDAKNGWNTYTMVGLPSTPIANPGRASIDAVMHPAKSGALYFVADGTPGGSVFADTLEQHNANVEKWRAIRAARGE